MKKVQTVAIVVGAMVIIGVLLLLLNQYVSQSTINYIENALDIRFRTKLEDLDLYDTGQFFVVMHARIAEDDQQQLMDLPANGDPADLDEWLVSLQEPNQVIPTHEDMHYFQGNDGEHEWHGAFDPQSGRLWLVFIFLEE